MATHDHGSEPTPEDRGIRKLGLVAAINLVGFFVELLGGLVFGSVALLGDAFHMLFDALAYVIALGATVIARRSNPSGRWSYGLHRIEPFAAFLNGVLLIPMVLYLLYESYQRYLSPVEINTTMTLLLATGGLVVNVASVYVLQGGEMSLNERGRFTISSGTPARRSRLSSRCLLFDSRISISLIRRRLFSSPVSSCGRRYSCCEKVARSSSSKAPSNRRRCE